MKQFFARLGAHFELTDHNRRMSSMEGLRGLAILLVLVCHYNGIIGQQLALPANVGWASKVIGLAGASGVDLFFLLSGFLIYRSTLRPNLNYFSFMHRRFERIYPTFLAVFALYLVFVELHLVPSRIPAGIGNVAAYLGENLLMLPGMLDIQAFIAAAWSLSYEWFFYLMIPLLVHALQMHRWTRRSRVLFFSALIVGYTGISFVFPERFPTFHLYDSTHVRLIMFGSGILVYEALESQRVRRLFTLPLERALAATAILCAALVVVLCALKASAGSNDGEWTASTGMLQVIPTFIGCSALALATLRPGALLASVFSANWLRWTGNISYSVYLMHSIPMHGVALALTRGPLRQHALPVYLLALPVTLVLVYAASAALFLAVEKPLSLRPKKGRTVVAFPFERRMTWALLTGEYPPQHGGVADYTLVLARALAADRDEVHVFAPPCEQADVPERRIVVHRLPDAYGTRGRRMVSAVLADLATPRAAIVQYVPQAFGMRGCNIPFARWLRSLSGYPLFVMFHEVSVNVGPATPFKYRVQAMATRAMAHSAIAAADRLFVSTTAWEPLVRGLGAPRCAIEWTPVPSNVGLSANPVTTAFARRRFAGAARLLLGHFGTYREEFANAQLTAVVPHVVNADRAMLFLGRGSEHFVERLTARYPALAGRVHATGGLEAQALADHLAACDLMIQPFEDGVTARRSSVTAALALGVPVLTTRGRLTEDLWTAGAVAFAAGNSAALTEQTRRLAGDAVKRAELRVSGRELYARQFSIEHTVATLQTHSTPSMEFTPA